MSPDESRNHIRHIRQDRRTKKYTATKKREVKEKVVKTKGKITKLADGLTQAQIDALIAQLEGK